MRNKDTRGRFRNSPKPETTKTSQNIFGGRQGSATTSVKKYSEKK